jgi:hypothetical protein
MKLRKGEREALAHIRKLVIDTHWIKGRYTTIDFNGKEKYCLVGFVNAETGIESNMGSRNSILAREKNTKRTRLLLALEHAMTELFPDTYHENIEYFNDKKSTKRKDILEVIDKALEY